MQYFQKDLDQGESNSCKGMGHGLKTALSCGATNLRVGGRRIRLVLIFILVGLACTYLYQNSVKEISWNEFDTPSLLARIAQNHLTAPADLNIPYNLSVSYKSWEAQDQFNKQLLEIVFQTRASKTNGFFVEAGALDGQHLSHTLDLERFYGWTGLLVEASRSLVPQLKSKNRKSWIADVCVTDKVYRKVEFMTRKNQTALAWYRGVGKVAEEPKLEKGDNIANYKKEGMVECFSLYSLLRAIPHRHRPTMVDLLVLDIEGEEYKVLESYPYSLLPIKVIAVEYWHSPEGGEKMIDLMSIKGYRLIYRSRSDFVFVMNS